MSVSTARSLPNCDVLPVGRRVEAPVVAEFAEGAGELAAQPLVLVSEFAVAAVRDFEATSQGVVAGALLGGYRCARLGSALVAESADLVGECPTGDANRPASSITFVIQELCGAPLPRQSLWRHCLRLSWITAVIHEIGAYKDVDHGAPAAC